MEKFDFITGKHMLALWLFYSVFAWILPEQIMGYDHSITTAIGRGWIAMMIWVVGNAFVGTIFVKKESNKYE